jgi:hypothetical protein
MIRIGFVFVDAFSRAKLFEGKPATNQPEAPITLMTALYRVLSVGAVLKSFLPFPSVLVVARMHGWHYAINNHAH